MTETLAAGATGVRPAHPARDTAGAGADARGAQALICAHRGASLRLPDNSIAAFVAAIESGCELIETDIRADGDGRLVLAHDPVVRRTLVHRTIMQRTLEHPAKLRRPRRERPRSRTPLMRARRRPRRPVATAPPLALQTLLELADGRIGLDLEIKEARVVEALLDAVAHWTGPLLLTSFDPAAIRAVRERAPWIETGLIAGPMHVGDPLANARACGADKLVLFDLRLTTKLLATASMPIWVWTVNQPARIARCLAEPVVECVITDDPATAVAVRSSL